MINIIIADDHQMVIDGLKSLLSTEDEIVVVGEANNGIQVMDMLRTENSVDLILLDINMPEMDGIETTREIRSKYPDIKILILTMYDKPEFIKNLIELGAAGYILKNTGRENLLDAIIKVNQGKEFYDKKVIDNIMSSFKPGSDNFPVKLTKREKDVIRLISQELTSSEIADKLFISTHTVGTHRRNLLSKLHVKNTAGLVKYALSVGIIKEQ